MPEWLRIQEIKTEIKKKPRPQVTTTHRSVLCFWSADKEIKKMRQTVEEAESVASS